MNDKLKQYFDAFPKADKLYETADGQVFVDKYLADSHAARLGKGAPVEHSDEPAGADDKEAAKERLLAIDFTVDPKTLDQPTLAKLAKTLEVESADQKKATLIDALAKLQTDLKAEQ